MLSSNQRWQRLLGWQPIDFEATSGIPFEESIKRFQTAYSLVPDGVAGPKTYGKSLELAHHAMTTQAASSSSASRLVLLSGAALIQAKRFWLGDIIDPPTTSDSYTRSRLVIDGWIRTPAGLNWHWEDAYEKDGDYEWCGTLPAVSYAPWIPVELRQLYFPSNYRLNRFFQGKPIGNEPPPKVKVVGERRLHVKLDEDSSPADIDALHPCCGDILLIGDYASGYGSHITMVEEWTGEEFVTIEANAEGAGPRGNIREGVVRRTRPVGAVPSEGKRKHARRLLRFAPSDLVT